MTLPTGQISAPATGDKLDYAEHLGRLLLIYPTEAVSQIQTTLGPKDAIRANVVVLDGPQAGRLIDDALIFPRVLISQLRSKLGGIVLGRLAQGVAKPGQNAPWTFTAPTDAELAQGQAYLSQQAQKAIQAPAAPQAQQYGAPPAQAGYAQQPQGYAAPQPQPVYAQQPQQQTWTPPPTQAPTFGPPPAYTPPPAQQPWAPNPVQADPPF